MVLCYFEGKSYDQAARELGWPKSTLTRRLSRARQRIKQILAKRDKEVFRSLRAVEVLEQAGTPEAREVLEVLATRAPNPRIAEAAGAALRRIAGGIR